MSFCCSSLNVKINDTTKRSLLTELMSITRGISILKENDGEMDCAVAFSFRIDCWELAKRNEFGMGQTRLLVEMRWGLLCAGSDGCG